MLDPHEHELLGINSYDVLNDVASHWKKLELSAQRMEQKYRSAHTQCTDGPGLSEHFS